MYFSTTPTSGTQDFSTTPTSSTQDTELDITMDVTKSIYWDPAGEHRFGPYDKVFWPLEYTTTEGRRHPIRIPKSLQPPCLYERYLPAVKETFSLRVVDIGRDLNHFHQWQNSERVNAFWGERTDDISKHRTYLEKALADPHLTPVIGFFDDVPVCYFELYWVKEDRVAPFSGTPGDYDRGWHALVGNSERRYRGPDRVGLWITSVTHFLFLQDVRTNRVLLEPRVDNDKFKDYLKRYGYVHERDFDFPHKRASLVSISRERFQEIGLAGGDVQPSVVKPPTTPGVVGPHRMLP